jgi:metal-sulfur cluster biosynthetic enzyme
MASTQELQNALRDVFDPEYPVSLVDMGLIRDIRFVDGTATVAISYCSLGCPCIALIEEEVEARLLEVNGVERVEVVESFEPWTRRHISRDALARLRQAGVG